MIALPSRIRVEHVPVRPTLEMDCHLAGFLSNLVQGLVSIVPSEGEAPTPMQCVTHCSRFSYSHLRFQEVGGGTADVPLLVGIQTSPTIGGPRRILAIRIVNICIGLEIDHHGILVCDAVERDTPALWQRQTFDLRCVHGHVLLHQVRVTT